MRRFSYASSSSSFVLVGRKLTLWEFVQREFDNDVWYIGGELCEGTNMFVVNSYMRDYLIQHQSDFVDIHLVESVHKPQYGPEEESFLIDDGIVRNKGLEVFIFEKDYCCLDSDWFVESGGKAG